MDNITLIQKLFKPLNIQFNELNEIINLEISRDLLLKPEIKKQYCELIPEFKKFYKTSKLTSLHSNSCIKQKTQSINMLRQVLKCNNLKLTPKVVSLGYSKINGKKI